MTELKDASTSEIFNELKRRSESDEKLYSREGCDEEYWCSGNHRIVIWDTDGIWSNEEDEKYTEEES
ncbi:MAG: hypothetical protein PHS80_00010 [Methanothrix sp.]|nr:hypothetical protein [Bacteroidales bacterium]MDD2753883.1 hypothetical protein [Methanothrix sp.]